MSCISVDECVRISMQVKALTKQEAETKAFKTMPPKFDDYIPIGLDAKLKRKNEWTVVVFLKFPQEIVG